MPRLGDLLDQPVTDDRDIAGLTADSRQVGKGFLFAALPGGKADGRAFIADALARGATALLVPTGTRIDDAPGVAVVADAAPRRRFARMAARFFGRQPEIVAAVTGTNGKTSVTQFTRQMWATLGFSAASLGTLGVLAPGIDRPGGLTTPDPVALHALLAELAGLGVTHAAMEASSHGLDQHRLEGVRLKAAAFTNLTRDHLDYHADMEAYAAAKMRLFSEVLAADGTAVVNADSPAASGILGICAARRLPALTYGVGGRDLRIDGAEPTPAGQRLRLAVLGRAREVSLPLAGGFQAANALAALGLVIACGGDAEAATAALEGLQGVPGRLQKVTARANGAPVFVDYAHTPDALDTVLRALRPHAARRLVVVFGCGGDRDAGKRPIMGRLAAELADLVIVTDDNPRGEDAAAIRRQIVAACPGADEIGDRRAAIRAAVSRLGAGDVLVIAGKGHEQGQIVGTAVLPFDDAEEARAAVADLGEAP